MNMKVTRNVVHDLWPLCQSGEASPDSQALVDAYLATDPEFTITLKETTKMKTAMPGYQLSPDAERRLLDEARSRARTRLLIIGGGIAAAALMLLVALFGVLMLYLRSS
jgi:ferric-dicitrate binding protein FerR (iron transport regulator)